MDTAEIESLIARCTREVIPDLDGHRFSREDRLSDLGANSIDRAEIVTMVLESLRLSIPRTAAFGVRNIGELADLLNEKCRAQ